MATDFPSSISELSAGLKQGEFSSVELTEHYLARIKSKNDVGHDERLLERFVITGQTKPTDRSGDCGCH